MRRPIVVLTILLCPALARAQQRAFVDVAGGPAAISGAASADVVGEGGVRIAANLFVFGDVGRFHNLQSPTLTSDADTIAGDFASSGLTLSDSAQRPAEYCAAMMLP